MKFYSTRKKSLDVDFKTALFQGIAPDGGLYMPKSMPQVSLEEVTKVATLQEVAFFILRKWILKEEIPDSVLQTIVADTFTFPIPLVSVGDYAVLELFHGPTMAFKDIAARVLARLFDYYLEKEKRTATILVSSSGDTGGAIAQALSGMKRVRVVVLYPYEKVSILQEEQMTRAGQNVLAIALDGVFDDCQSFVKRAFQDSDLQKLNLSSANSMNIGRLIPQTIYYVWAYHQLKKKKVRFVVPSGNMGNVTAALFAKRMGVPIESFVIATNENDVAVRYYQTGVYKNKASVQTLSTAMDIGRPSNFERVLELFGHDYARFCRVITAIKITDAETVKTIRNIYKKDTYLLDFHTAVGFCAAEKLPVADTQTVVVSTASPLKFAKEMKRTTGITVDDSHLMKAFLKKKKHVIRASNDYDEIKKLLVEQIG